MGREMQTLVRLLALCCLAFPARGAVGRFNKPVLHPREQRVDEHLWKLYRGIAAGGDADLRTCGVEKAGGL